MRNSFMHSVAAAGLLVAASSSASAGTWISAVPVQGSTSMILFGINDNNIVTGGYTDSSGVQHGFVGPFDGSDYTSFDDPDGSTEPRALSDKGVITGYDLGSLVPWERSAKGTLKPVTKGGASLNQIAQGINKSGVFAGNYLDTNSVSVGYLGEKFKYQSKIKLSLSNTGLAGRAIDSAGDVGGWYYDPNTGLQRGFIIVGGAATSLDYPSANYTVVEGLNDKGYVSGQYQDSGGVIHGFLYKISTAKFTSLDAPGASLTQVWGIDNQGNVAASADVGNFIYCMKAKNCPTAGAGIVKRVPGKRALP